MIAWPCELKKEPPANPSAALSTNSFAVAADTERSFSAATLTRHQRPDRLLDSTGRRNTLNSTLPEGGVADEAETENLLYRNPKGAHVGALEEGGIPSPNSPVVRSKPLIDTANSCRVWRHSPSAEAAV